MSPKKQKDTAQRIRSSLLRNVRENKQLKPILRKRLIAVRPLKRGGKKSIHGRILLHPRTTRENIYESCAKIRELRNYPATILSFIMTQ